MKSSLDIPASDEENSFINKDLKLKENEVIQFRLPNLKTTKTYPAYVNYYAKLDTKNDSVKPAIPATMQTLLRFIERGASDETGKATA
jgi:hypothetical protein